MRPLIYGLILMTSLTGYAQAVEIQRWERIPLAVPLIVGQERIVFVDQNVRIGHPRTLVGRLRVQSTGGAIYLLANEPIEPTRLQLQNVTSGEVMLVDIAASIGKANQAALEPVRIVAGEQQSSRYGQINTPQKSTQNRSHEESVVQESSEDSPTVRRETPIPVVITRYAAQMLYAPFAPLSLLRAFPRSISTAASIFRPYSLPCLSKLRH